MEDSSVIGKDMPRTPKSQMSLAGNISSRRLAAFDSRAAARLQAAFDASLLNAGEDEGALAELKATLVQMTAKVSAVEAKAKRANKIEPIHVTLSTKYAGDAYEKSVAVKKMLESFGCTVYNPNTDCEQKPGDDVKGASNWLQSFREEGLLKSLRTRGFVLQLQADAERERSDMQKAEQGMAGEIAKLGVPIIGMYGEFSSFGMDLMIVEVPKALDLSRRQWESGSLQAQAVPTETHNLGDDGAQWLASYFAAMGSLAQCVELNLDRNQIGDAGLSALASACAGGAMAGVRELWLSGNQFGDAGVEALSSALARGALAKCQVLGLQNNRIGDAGVEALAKAAACGALAAITFIDLDRNKVSEAGKKAMRDVAQARGFRVDLA